MNRQLCRQPLFSNFIFCAQALAAQVLGPVFLFSAMVAFGCAQSTFRNDNGTIRHGPTGAALPSKLNAWVEQSSARRENLNPALMGILSYEWGGERQSETEAWRPEAKVYIMREKTTANLAVAVNYQIASNAGYKLLTSESVPENDNKSLLLSTYETSVSFLVASGSGAKTLKTLPALSLFATSENDDSNLVVSVTIERDSKAEKAAAMELTRSLIFGNQP